VSEIFQTQKKDHPKTDPRKTRIGSHDSTVCSVALYQKYQEIVL